MQPNIQPYVLAVVGDEDARSSVAAALAWAGFDVATAATAEAAEMFLRRPGQRSPDALVFDDRSAPDRDAAYAGDGAATFLQRFRSRVAAPVLVVTTGHSADPVMLADQLLVRPLSTEELAAAVTRALPDMIRRGAR